MKKSLCKKITNGISNRQGVKSGLECGGRPMFKSVAFIYYASCNSLCIMYKGKVY